MMCTGSEKSSQKSNFIYLRRNDGLIRSIPPSEWSSADCDGTMGRHADAMLDALEHQRFRLLRSKHSLDRF